MIIKSINSAYFILTNTLAWFLSFLSIMLNNDNNTIPFKRIITAFRIVIIIVYIVGYKTN